MNVYSKSFFVAALLWLNCLSAFAQFPEYKIQSSEYYRQHLYPSAGEVKKRLESKIKYAIADDSYFTLAKRPDGYYLVEMSYEGVVKNAQLCWSLEYQRYMSVSLKSDSKPTSAFLSVTEGSYYHNLFYGYDKWYDDVMKVYEGAVELNCDESSYLARALDMKSNSLLFNNTADNTYKDNFYAFKRSDEELKEVVKCRMEALKYYNRSAELCPEKDRVVGSAVFKAQCINMAFYYDLMLLGYIKYAQPFLEKANFESFYVNIGKNLLNECAPNGVLFVGGDADTYLCVYVQDKLNYRKDVVVINTSLSQTGWYISYMKNVRQIKTTQPISFYNDELSSIMYVDSEVGPAPITYKELSEKISKKNADIVEDNGTKKYLKFPYTTINAGTYIMDFSKTTYLGRYELFLADLLASNDRSIYFSATVSDEDYKSVLKYAVLEGLVYKIDLNYEKHSATSKVNLKVCEENLMNRLVWVDVSGQKLLEGEKSRFAHLYRSSFMDYINASFSAGHNDKTIAAADKIITIIPDEIIPYDYVMAEIARVYYAIGETDKAKQLAKICAKRVDEFYQTHKDNHECTTDKRYEYYKTYRMSAMLADVKCYERYSNMSTIAKEIMQWTYDCD